MLDRGDLRGYQERAVAELTDALELQVIIGMGGGKTATCLTAYADLKAAHEDTRVIVLAPKRVARQVWPREHLKWAHLSHLDVVLLDGGPKQREARLREDHDVYVLGIDNAGWLADTLTRGAGHHFHVLVIDELSKLKGPRSKRGKKLLKIRHLFDACWGLTGTPRPNGYEDQFMPLRVLSGDRAWEGKNFDQWRRENFMPMDYYGYTWKVHEFAKPLLDKRISAYSIVVAPDEMPDLPDLNTGEDFIDWVDLAPDAAAAYIEMEKHLLVRIREQANDTWTEDDFVAALSEGVKSGKLAQIAQGFIYTGDLAKRFSNAKLDALAERLEGLNEPALIAYHYREDLAVLRDLLGGAPNLGAGVSDADGDAALAAWNAGDVQRMLIHPASAGHGIELQHGPGRTLIWYTPTWSPELYDQTLKRLWRPGIGKPCFNYQILARGTVDEIKFARVAGKMSEQDAFRAMLKRV